jgi:hypothetical protein
MYLVGWFTIGPLSYNVIFDFMKIDTNKNFIFMQLAVIAMCYALAASASYFLSFMHSSLGYRDGVPKDLAITYSFLYASALALIINIFLPRGWIGRPKVTEVVSDFFRSLLLVAIPWAICGFFAISVVTSFRGKIPGEIEWFQISLVLIASSITLVIWHFHEKKNGQI